MIHYWVVQDFMCNFLNCEKNKTINIEYVSRFTNILYRDFTTFYCQLWFDILLLSHAESEGGYNL